jgi:hypothetical protein
MEDWGEGHRGSAAQEVRSTSGSASVRTGVAMRHDGGEVGALPHRCSLLLGGAPAAAMKGPRWLHRRGLDTGATKGSQHGGGGSDDDGVPTAAVCALVASLMAVWRQQRAREIKFCEVIQAKGGSQIYNVKYQQRFHMGTAVEGCISTMVQR